MNDDGLFNAVSLFGAMANGPANSGEREDGKICTGQGGECRFNSKYYSLGMRDAKSWSMPHADETCPERCPYLREESRDMGSSQERHERVGGIIEAMGHKKKADELSAIIFLGSLGIDLGDDDV